MVVDRFILPFLPINQEYSHPARVDTVESDTCIVVDTVSPELTVTCAARALMLK
jgi:hypothetical protein